MGKLEFDLTDLKTHLQTDSFTFSRSHVVYSVCWPVRGVSTSIDCWLLLWGIAEQISTLSNIITTCSPFSVLLVI